MSTVSEGTWPAGRVVSFAQLSHKARVRRDIGEICRLCAAEESLAAAGSAEVFIDHWLNYYVADHPDLLLVAFEKQGEITAYLSGCLASAAAKPLFEKHGHYRVFEDLYAEFPAHFHINCHPDFQRRGHGRRLVERFLQICHQGKVPGVHLVTAPGMENLEFYRALGFRPLASRRSGGRDYLLMGQRLPGPR